MIVQKKRFTFEATKPSKLTPGKFFDKETIATLQYDGKIQRLKYIAFLEWKNYVKSFFKLRGLLLRTYNLRKCAVIFVAWRRMVVYSKNLN